ncbi:putative polyketide synthase 17 [Talaromyces islandicus]|uniref:Putative polyketide synthase 17 n=1 Tax=Talaromyces islandicus TaxID=28573 RepID=A0A0U1M0V8_TALIS|nr:putative polyketide synthase 17 [Talaromyces islandicus]
MPFLKSNSSDVPRSDLHDVLGKDESMPIAIVGIACRLPGEATCTDKLWELLAKKEAAWSKMPEDRMNMDAFYHPDGERGGNINAIGGHFLKQDVGAFDTSFFSIPPTEAKSIDPQQRLLMETVYEAMENGGFDMESFAGSDTSCYVGSFSHDYYEMIDRDVETAPIYSVTGNGTAILSNRISYIYDLKGPSLTLDTACSSSLVALHLACQSLRTGESHRAIVGATNVILNPDIMAAMSNVHFFSPDSRCWTFDERANGYSRGEGIATLILKPLADALQDNDTIRAVIRGTGCNQDGKTSGIMLPSSDAQASLIRDTYRQAGLDFSQTGFFEAHGTGTPAGDPLETSAIGSVFAHDRPVDEEGQPIPLYIGSIKTNVGHTEGASGLAGVIKSVLQLEHGAIAPNTNFERPNPQIDFDGWNIKVPTEVIPWPLEGQRRISVNSFGFGGTNGHVILDDAYNYLASRGLKGAHRTSPTPALGYTTMIPNSNTVKSISAADNTDQASSDATVYRRKRVFLWSTHEEGIGGKSSAAYAEHLAQRKEDDEETFLDNLSYTLCNRRSMLPWKSFLVADSLTDLVAKVAATRQTPVRPLPHALRTGFVFTGQGAQWFAMGRDLSKVYPTFQQRLKHADVFIKNLGADWSLLEELGKDEEESRINECLVSQTACTALQVALVGLLASWNIFPQKVIGHSSGEIAAAYAAGILPFESAMKAAYYRGLHSSQVQIKLPSADGAMMAVGITEERAKEKILALDQTLGKAFVACVNSPTNITVSGDRPALEAISKDLQEENAFVRFLKVSTAYHSHHMEAVAGDYEESLKGMEVNAISKDVEMVSTVTGDIVKPTDVLGPSYWCKNMVGCVRFNDGLQVLCAPRATTKRARRGAGAKAGIDVLLEVGPHAALAGPIKQCLGVPALEKSGIVYKSVLSRGHDACQTTLEAATFLFAKGRNVDLYKANFPESVDVLPQVIVDLPTYFWNHSKHHWFEGRLSLEHRFRRHARTDFLGYPVNDWNPMEPRWRNILQLREQPWLKGHVVQGSYVFPGAGYVSMAIEAMQHLTRMPEYTTPKGTLVGFKLKDIKINRALIIPSTDDGIETSFSMRHYKESSSSFSNFWYEFRLFSWTSEGWNEHGHGLISPVYEPEIESAANNFPYAPRLRELLKADEFAGSISADTVYETVGRIGLNYEDPFRGLIGDIKTNSGEAKGRVTVPDVKKLMPYEYEVPYLIHPATMDTFIHLLFPALMHDNPNPSSPYIPVTFDEIFVRDDINQTPGHNFDVVAAASFTGFREATAQFILTDATTGEPMVAFNDVKCSGLEVGGRQGDEEEGSTAKKLTFHATWHPDPNLLPQAVGDSMMAPFMPKVSDPDRIANLEAISYYYYYQVLQKVGESQVVTMKPHLQKYYRFMQHQRDLVAAHKNAHQTPEWEQFDNPEVCAKMEALASQLETTGNDAKLIVRVGRKLDKIMTGDIDPLALMLEDELLYRYYEGVMSFDILYQYTSMLSNKNPNMKCVEIGGGTGGATGPILNAMGGNNGRYPRFKSYTFTDISSGFFAEAEEKFKDWDGLIDYRRLNIEEDPVEQGFTEGEYDLVVAASVLHATTNIDRTLSHTRKLLKPGGRLVLVEISNILNQAFILFGCLPGWWMSEESYRQWGPTMDQPMWENALKRNGFSSLSLAAPDHVNPQEELGRLFSCIAVDQSPSIAPEIHSITLVTDGENDPSPVENAIQQQLGEIGLPVNKVPLSKLSRKSLANTFVLSIAEIERSVTKDMKLEEFDGIKHIIKNSEGLLWVTEGGLSIQNTTRPDSAIFHGLARSLRSEYENFPLVTADFAVVDRQAPDVTVGHLANLVRQTLHDPKKQDPEYWHDGICWHINRCVESTEINADIQGRISNNGSKSEKIEAQKFYQPERALKLKIKNPGLLDTLMFEDDLSVAEPLGADEVEVEVKASGINFRDIMISSGQMSDTSLGLECGGIVSCIGSNVTHLKVGQRVAAWTDGNFSHYARTHAGLAQAIPDDMSFATAASLPIVYTTVIYGLQHVARLRKGESILIHAAAGGVGQAAIILAQLIGADIFVTVGTQTKRELVKKEFGIPDERIFSSRDLRFAQQIKVATGGRGVNVVLNSLAGDALSATWESIAMFGRFIEMGKKDLVDNRRLEMSTFLRNVTFASIDLMTVFRHDPSLAGQLLEETLQLIHAKSIRPIPSLTTFSFSQVEEAFRYMQQGKHVGKVVLVPEENDTVKAPVRSSSQYTFPHDGSYLITGFGGLGRSMARWMASRGAKNLIFASRSGAVRPEVQELVVELQESGVRIEILKVDITDGAALRSGLAGLLQSRNLPPLRGVIQAAMVLEDQIFENMPLESFNNGIRPKVHGSWNLHEATLDKPLDFFIILASAIGVIGNSGQANYSAGNAFEDALCQWRRARGLPAIAIDLGMMLDVGAVAEDNLGLAQRNLERKGFVGIREQEFLTILEIAVQDETHKSTHNDIRFGQMITGIEPRPATEGAEDPTWRSLPVFSHLPKLSAENNNTSNSTAAQSTASLLKAAVTLNDAVAIILDATMTKLSRSLMIDLAEMDPLRPTSAYGVDSLIAVEVRNWFMKEVKADIAVFEILQANSIQGLVYVVAEKSALIASSVKENE